MNPVITHFNLYSPLPIERYTTLLNTDLEFCRRLKLSEQKNIQNAFNQLTDVDSSVDRLVSAMNESHWEDNAALLDPKMPFYALIAFQEELITDFQLGTLLQFWGALQYHGDSNEFTSYTTDQSIDHLRKTLVNPDDDSPYRLTEEQFLVFLEKMRSQPLSERIFFLVPSLPIPDLPDDEAGDCRGIFSAIYNFTTFKPFGLIHLNGGVRRFLPSFSMQQAYLESKFGAKAVRLNPTIGVSSLVDIRKNGLHSTRDVGLSFPHALTPKLADYYLAPWYDFGYHDFYHAAVASSVPPEHRMLMGTLSDVIDRLLAERRDPIIAEAQNFLDPKQAKLVALYAEESENKTLCLLKLVLNEMEHLFYMNTEDEDLSDVFWKTLIYELSLVFSNYNLIYHRKQACSGSFASLDESTKEKVLFVFCQALRSTSVSSSPEDHFSSLKQKIREQDVGGEILGKLLVGNLFLERILRIWGNLDKTWEEYFEMIQSL